MASKVPPKTDTENRMGLRYDRNPSVFSASGPHSGVARPPFKPGVLKPYRPTAHRQDLIRKSDFRHLPSANTSGLKADQFYSDSHEEDSRSRNPLSRLDAWMDGNNSWLALEEFKLASKTSFPRIMALDPTIQLRYKYVRLVATGLDVVGNVVGGIAGLSGALSLALAGASLVPILAPITAPAAAWTGSVAAYGGLISMAIAGKRADMWKDVALMGTALQLSGAIDAKEAVGNFKKTNTSIFDVLYSLVDLKANLDSVKQVSQGVKALELAIADDTLRSVADLKLFSGAQFVQKARAVSEWIFKGAKLIYDTQDAYEALVAGIQKILNFGKEVAQAVGKGVRSAYKSGTEKAAIIGKNIYDFGASIGPAAKGAWNKFANWIAPPIRGSAKVPGGQALNLPDGAMTGPFFPVGEGQVKEVSATQLVASGQATIFVNGVNTSLQKHIHAAQALANELNSPVIGVFNASGTESTLFGKKWLGGARDWFQAGADKLDLFGSGKLNPATQTLADLIFSYGNASKPRGGLNIVAHSQGSLIVSNALAYAQERAQKGEGKKNILGRIDVTTLGNAANTMPKGLKGQHHYVFDGDPISALVGSTSFMNKLFRGNDKTTLTSQSTTMLHHEGQLADPHELVGNGDGTGFDANGRPLHGVAAPDGYIANLKRFKQKERFEGRLKGTALGGLVYKFQPSVHQVRAATQVVYGVGKFAVQKSYEAGSKVFTEFDHFLAKHPMLAANLDWQHYRKQILGGAHVVKSTGQIIDKTYNTGLSALDPPRIQKSGHPGISSLDPRLLRRSLLKTGGVGNAPSAEMRDQLQGHLGFDLGVARIHTHPAAAQTAAQLNAHAFTIGQDIFFGAGEFDPHSARGRGLLAHELTHVAQQLGHRGRRRFGSGSGEHAMEQEARSVEADVFHRPTRGQGCSIGQIEIEQVFGDDQPEEVQRRRIQSIADRVVAQVTAALRSMPGNGEEYDLVEVDVHLDLRMSDDECVERWRESILSKVKALRRRAKPASQASLQRSEVFDSKIIEHEAQDLGTMALGVGAGALLGAALLPGLVGVGVGYAALAGAAAAGAYLRNWKEGRRVDELDELLGNATEQVQESSKGGRVKASAGKAAPRPASKQAKRGAAQKGVKSSVLTAAEVSATMKELGNGAFTFKEEGGSPKPTVPSDESGVTLWGGYDLHQQSPARIQADLRAAGLDDARIALFVEAKGFVGAGGREWIKDHPTATISKEEALKLFGPTYRRKIEPTARNVGSRSGTFSALSPRLKQLAVDLQYHGSYDAAGEAKMRSKGDAYKWRVKTNDIMMGQIAKGDIEGARATAWGAFQSHGDWRYRDRAQLLDEEIESRRLQKLHDFHDLRGK